MKDKLKIKKNPNFNQSLRQTPFQYLLIRAVPFLLVKRLSDPLRVSLLKCQHEIIIDVEGLLNSSRFKGDGGKKVTEPKKGEIVIIHDFLLKTNLPYFYEKYLQISS